MSERRITCHKCGYTWATRSQLRYVNCPKCRTCVKNPYFVPLYKSEPHEKQVLKEVDLGYARVKNYGDEIRVEPPTPLRLNAKTWHAIARIAVKTRRRYRAVMEIDGAPEPHGGGVLRAVVLKGREAGEVLKDVTLRIFQVISEKPEVYTYREESTSPIDAALR